MTCFCHSGLCSVFSLYHYLACRAISPHPDASPTSGPPQNVHAPGLELNISGHWACIYSSEPPFPQCDYGTDCWSAPNIHYSLLPSLEHVTTFVDISKPALLLHKANKPVLVKDWPMIYKWECYMRFPERLLRTESCALSILLFFLLSAFLNMGMMAELLQPHWTIRLLWS